MYSQSTPSTPHFNAATKVASEQRRTCMYDTSVDRYEVRGVELYFEQERVAYRRRLRCHPHRGHLRVGTEEAQHRSVGSGHFRWRTSARQSATHRQRPVRAAMRPHGRDARGFRSRALRAASLTAHPVVPGAGPARVTLSGERVVAHRLVPFTTPILRTLAGRRSAMPSSGNNVPMPRRVTVSTCARSSLKVTFKSRALRNSPCSAL